MAEKLGFDDELLWAPETYKLGDIIREIPTLVRVTEGIYSCHDAGTFSQGDIIKIDACKPMTRVCAYLSQPGSNTRYESYGEEISLPYFYNGRVQVMPMHGDYYKYTSVEQLINYFPRYIRVLGRVSFKETSGKERTLKPRDNLELKAVRRGKSGVATSLRCTLNNEDVILPRSLAGIFQVLPDEKQQTIRDVVETYKLPQCVRFIGSGIQEIMSKDIQEAIDNLTSYSGEMIVMGKKESAPVLFGHYKGMDGDSSSRFCRRSAIVIPLDVPEISEIEVQLPNYTDSDDYELFLLKNFSESSSKPQVLEGALYVEFAKTSRVQFISTDTAPAIPPRRTTEEARSEHMPPPVSSPPQGVVVLPMPKQKLKSRPKPEEATPSQKPAVLPAKPRPQQHVESIPLPHHAAFLPPPHQVIETSPKPCVASTKPYHKAVLTPPQHHVSPTGSYPKVALTPPEHRKVATTSTQHHTVHPSPSPPRERPESEGIGMTISDVFAGDWSSVGEDIYEPTEELSPNVELPTAERKKINVKKSIDKIIEGIAKKVLPDKKQTAVISETPEDFCLEADATQREGDEQVHYDYIDMPTDYARAALARRNEESKLSAPPSGPFGSKPTQRVMPNTCRETKPDQGTEVMKKQLKDLTISDLEVVLINCGMSDLAKVCKQECVDGNWFSSLTTSVLKKKPFSLSDFHVQKVEKIQGGWRPKT